MYNKFSLIFLSLYLFLAYLSLGTGLHSFQSKGLQNIFSIQTSHDQAILKRHKRGLYGVEKAFFVKAFKALDSHQGTEGKSNGYEVQFIRLSAGASQIDWRLLSSLEATGYIDAIDKVTAHLNTALRHGSPHTRKLAIDAAKLIPGVVNHRDKQMAPYIEAGTQDSKHVFVRNHWNQKWTYFEVLAGLPPPLPDLPTTNNTRTSATSKTTGGTRGRKG